MDIRSNARKLAASWEKRAAKLRPVMKTATAEATKVFLAESKRQMTKLIYDKPIPTKEQMREERKGRAESQGRKFSSRKFRAPKDQKGTTQKREGQKPAWHRSGNLRRSEKSKVVSAYVGMVTNDAKSTSKSKKKTPYAAARHYMKSRYPAPWRDKASESVREKINQVYLDAMKQAINVGIVTGPE